MTTCPKCHHEHNPNLCQGHVIKDPLTRKPINPRQCAKTPVKGSTVCRSHGAAKGTPAAAKAVERRAEAAAQAAIAELIPLVGSSEPVKDPIDLLARVAGMLETATDRVAGRVNTLQGRVGAGEHLTQLRAEVVLLEKLLGHLRAVARDLAALGIAERQVELAAGQAEIVVGAFRAGLAVAGSELLPDVRDGMLRAFLGALPGASAVVAGEVEAS